MTSCIALVVAAGRGTRLTGDVPKQYRRLGGKPLLRHALENLAAHDSIGAVRAVIHGDDRGLYDEAAAGLELLPPVEGGPARQDSVRLGLESLGPLAPERVLIHDAARPFAGAALVARVVAALDTADGAIPALAMTDTVKRGDGDRVTETVERTKLWRAQTPQGFRFASILAAHRAAQGSDLPDDAAVAERAGLTVRLVAGSEENFKVTTEDDLGRAEGVLATRLGDVRMGQGFDVHPFGAGDHVWLCGVRVPHGAGLVGHSDADVGLHALTDALLGALGAGDIGMHFPPSDPRWKGAASHQFLAHARSLVAAAGGAIANVDVTIVCEAPRIGPHRDAMIARIAEILRLPRGRVSVKATTTERLGFTGRGEGMAAYASATVRLPL